MRCRALILLICLIGLLRVIYANNKSVVNLAGYSSDIQNSKNRHQANAGKLTPKLYAKVLSLFDKLSLCDKDDFDPEHVAPHDSSSVKKVMMALDKVASKNWIKKADESRYKRIMRNCGRLVEVMQKRIDSQLSEESQLSGITFDDSRTHFGVSPFEQIRERILGQSRVGGFRQLELLTKTTTTTTTEAPVIATLDVREFVRPQPNHTPEFFQFL